MDPRTTLAPALAGRYEIEREIGRGGMATVFLARDVKHDRRVAIKVLDAELAALLGVERFLSEIRVTANLQHPNLLPLFDSGEAAGLLYYVMPFVDGESLRAKLDRERQLPVDEAVRIASAIASAAEYAHANGVVHRDLKPENILMQSGQPIVADFGIALAVSNAGGPRATATGLSLGTPQYMSPEQAMGDRAIDARSDVYAIGAMAYEMLVGEPPHKGATAQAVIAKVLTERPPRVWENRRSVPEHVDAAVARALEKLPADRIASAKELADALQGRITAITPSMQIARGGGRLSLIAAGVIALVAIVSASGWWRAAHAPPPAPVHFVVDPPEGLSIQGGPGMRLALSRDGQTLAFIAGLNRLFLRRLDQVDPIAFTKASPARELHFSADGQSLISVNRGLHRSRVDPSAAGVEALTLVRLEKLVYVAWTYSSDIVYLGEGVFWRVSAEGGTPTKLATMDTTVDAEWLRPTMLPDGKTVAFAVIPRGSKPGTLPRLALLSIDGGVRRLTDLQSTGVVGYLDGILLFVRGDGRLSAVKFDVATGRTAGPFVDVVDYVAMGASGASVSDNGTLAYLTSNPPARKVEVLDERAAVAWSLPDVRAYGEVVWSPDGQHIAMSIMEHGQSDVWVYHVASRVMQQLTQTGGQTPAWTPDSKRVAFAGMGSAAGKVLWMPADGSSAAEVVPGTAAVGAGAISVAFSPDGRYVITRRELRSGEPIGTPQALAIPLGGGEPIPMLDANASPTTPVVSPNGKWMTFSSRETGQHEVYIRAFPRGTGKVQVSTDGGTGAQWSKDGRTLFYRHENEFRSVTLDLSGDLPRVIHSTTAFSSPSIGSSSVAPDGKHVAVVRDLNAGFKLVVVTNWMTEVRQKLAGK